MPLAVKETSNSQTEVATKKPAKTASKAKAKSGSSTEQDLNPAAEDKPKQKLNRLRRATDTVLSIDVHSFEYSLSFFIVNIYRNNVIVDIYRNIGESNKGHSAWCNFPFISKSLLHS